MRSTPGHSRGLTDDEIHELLESISDQECFSESSNSSESDSDVLDDIVNESEDEMEDSQYTEVIAPETLQPLPHPFQKLPGPKHMPPAGSSVIEYFNLFFTTTLLQLIVTERNLSAKQFISKHAATLSKPYKKWKNVTTTEVRGFIACLLNMGLNKRPTMLSYWSTKPSQAFPWFGKMFSAHRFRHLMKFFHLVDSEKCPAPGHPDYDPCIRYQPLVDHANNIFRHHYTPHEQLSIDESLVGTKCHTSLLQYLPNKHHHRWGIKFWMLCDSITHYCLGFYTYRGAKSQEDKDDIAKHGLGYCVVQKLLHLGNYLNKGYHIFVDNFFMSVPLVKSLYKLGTYITGTVRKNRKYLPEQFRKKFGIGEKMYCKSGPVLACAYREKKSLRTPVLLLSSKVGAGDIEVQKRNKTVKKPLIIHQYNQYMGGIDTSDMMLYAYLDERRTLRYWKKVAFNIMSRMVLNSYILYKEHNKGSKIVSRYVYTLMVIEALSTEWLQEKVTTDDPSGSPGLRKLPEKKESRCCVCTSEGRKRRSRTVCNRCNKGLHGECFPKHKC